MKSPPSKYNSSYIDDIKKQLNDLKYPKQLNVQEKSECYNLYVDMNQKSSNLQDLGIKAETQSGLSTSIDNYSRIVQSSIDLYNKTCN